MHLLYINIYDTPSLTPSLPRFLVFMIKFASSLSLTYILNAILYIYWIKAPRKPGGFAKTAYKLSPILSKVTGETQLPRPQVVKKIWEYIKVCERGQITSFFFRILYICKKSEC